MPDARGDTDTILGELPNTRRKAPQKKKERTGGALFVKLAETKGFEPLIPF